MPHGQDQLAHVFLVDEDIKALAPWERWFPIRLRGRSSPGMSLDGAGPCVFTPTPSSGSPGSVCCRRERSRGPSRPRDPSYAAAVVTRRRTTRASYSALRGRPALSGDPVPTTASSLREASTANTVWRRQSRRPQQRGHCVSVQCRGGLAGHRQGRLGVSRRHGGRGGEEGRPVGRRRGWVAVKVAGTVANPDPRGEAPITSSGVTIGPSCEARQGRL